MKIKVIYRKNLKMSEGKVAAQCVHAAMYYMAEYNHHKPNIVVLGVSDAKFDRECTNRKGKGLKVQNDLGLTEVAEGTPTAAAWIEYS